MPAKPLPPRPSLEQYKKQAKDLVHAHKSGDPDALRRIGQHHPRLSKLPDAALRTAPCVLADAQVVIAREHGFDSWPKFAKHIEHLISGSAPASVWKAAARAVIAADATTLDRLRHEHARVLREQHPPPYVPSGPGPSYVQGDARSIIAREHHFESWEQLAAHLDRLKHEGSPAARFEAAVDAVVTGDVATLERLLRDDPELARARSTRTHHATLLHYVGANGIEGFRQKTPKNAVRVAEILLQAGAEVDATAGMYGGGSTTLGLVATSIHPLRAGVQGALIELLLEHGAAAEDGAVNGCLANGRGEAAELLARRGARLDLEGAAGVGRLDVVTGFFNEDGSLKATATAVQMKDGFAWACEFGRATVVDFLLQRGVDVGARLRHHGQTGLHWAALGAHVETVKLLLARHAPVDVTDEHFGGTPIAWALHGWGEAPPEAARGGYYEVVALLVAAGGTTKPEWLADENIRADRAMLAALSGDRIRRD
jgi:hypothetical protein